MIYDLLARPKKNLPSLYWPFHVQKKYLYSGLSFFFKNETFTQNQLLIYSMREFKYQKWFDELKVPCPPEEYLEKETIAFRWVFEDLDDERNFIPQFLKKPERFQNSPLKAKCRAFGLSMFDSEESALASFRNLINRTKIKSSKVGTHLAKGKISGYDGVSSTADTSGHFTFHPFLETDLKHQFEIISNL